MFSTLLTGMRLKPKGKNQKMEAESGGSAILKEVFSSYEELSSREVIFIHHIPADFFYRKLKSDNFRMFSSDLLGSQDPR